MCAILKAGLCRSKLTSQEKHAYILRLLQTMKRFPARKKELVQDQHMSSID